MVEQRLPCRFSHSLIPSVRITMTIGLAGRRNRIVKRRGPFSKAALAGCQGPGGRKEERKECATSRDQRKAASRRYISGGQGHLEQVCPLACGQYHGRGPLVTRYMPTKDTDRRPDSAQLAFVTRTIDDMSHHGIRRRAGTNYESP